MKILLKVEAIVMFICNNDDFEHYFSLEFGNRLIENYKELLNDYCLIILKPECLLTDRCKDVIPILQEDGFEIAYIVTKSLDQSQVFSLWKYGWQNASIPRVIMNYAIMSYYPCVIILLKSPPNISTPCEFLNEKKGRIYKNGYQKDSIRGRLNSINIFLNYIHVSDTLDDMIRELIILLSYNEFIDLCKNISKNVFFPLNNIILETQPYIKNLHISNPHKLFKEYIENFSLENSEKERYYKKELTLAYNNREISTDLFINLLKDGALIWNWETIIVFSNFIVTSDNS